MILAHFPAGYIASKLLFPRFKKTGVSVNTFLFWNIFGAVAPDLDMFYFYFIDHGRHHHHTYFTHFPIVWFSLLMISIFWFQLAKNRIKPSLAFVFSLGGCIHIILDTLAGDIWWLAPFLDKPFALATVPAVYQPWWLNFFLHWSFGFEILIFVCAIYLWGKRTKKSASSMHH